METNINIADLVTPKFRVGQDVWAVSRNYNKLIESILVRRIQAITFSVTITQSLDRKEIRTVTLTYHTGGGGEWSEDQLYASLNDIPHDVRIACFA